MVSNPSNFVIKDCQFIDYSTADGSGLKILYGASLPDAAYDSAARASALVHSIPKTEHEDFVAEFVTWTRRPDSSVMWLDGPKSNLAQLCAEKLQEELAASFFTPQSQRTEGTSQIVITLADQLATHIPSYASVLDAKLRRNPALITKSLTIQFRELIFAPIEEVLASGIDLGPRNVIIVEGIDECASVHARCEILGAILESASRLPFLWAIFSRPDSQLEALLKERHLALKSCWKVCHPTPSFPVGDGEFFWRVELIRHEGWIAVRWALATRDAKIITGTAFFFT
ncbi:hypothetical protein P691DRAFT_808685 [Macrolepiota fuliginosa MF-IS2]|uniref:Nephrocystin 3-like N-terminal domain-containing protein n=1 Tax=Macrolepiota fuliginosa MF-IS2 TaxID=1400762 RepID=A0A9P5X3Z0_9AGAR|nr:hypothetical protein P691DRAFT_808685 [Macrolepiota fuliginosa MF-IS2]